MGPKATRPLKSQSKRCETEPASASTSEGQAVLFKGAAPSIDYEHFVSDPSMVDIADELAMVSAKVNIEDFKILKVLGRGTYGKVMLVQHKDEGTLFALKTLRKRKVIKTSQVEHTKAERRILEKMEHPFIVTLRYAFQTKAKLYMVFDFISGGELFQHLKTVEYFSEDRAKFYAAEILLALEFLHKKHIIYRDLKPENVLVDTEGHVKLTDFGLAKQLEEEGGHGRTTTFCGTDEYLAPEIILNEPYNESVDMWALGILIYEMLTGWAPWQDNNRKVLFDKIVNTPLDISQPNLSANAKDLLQKMLTKKVADRMKLPDIKKHAFFAGLDFHKLYMKSIKPPFKPEVKSPTDVTNFGEEFTKEDPYKETPQVGPLSPSMTKKGGRLWLFCDRKLFPRVLVHSYLELSHLRISKSCKSPAKSPRTETRIYTDMGIAVNKVKQFAFMYYADKASES